MKASGKGVRSAVAVLMGGTLFVCYAVGLAESRYPVLKGFELGNACEPIAVLVELLPTGAVEMGLTRETIITMVRARLRAARLYTRESEPYLYVHVNAGSQQAAFSVRLQFMKVLSDPISGAESFAPTWEKDFVGQAWEADYILSTVSLLMDQFLDEYLRVNEEACQRRE